MDPAEMDDVTGGRMLTVGSRAQVMHGTAKRTSGGLTKKALKYNKSGKIVSVRKSKTAKSIGLLKKWEKKTGTRWTIKNGKPHKVSRK